jgi:two-component system OmpR family sensor kinase
MRQLFVKFILAFWLAFVAISATVTGAAWLIRAHNPQWAEFQRRDREGPPPMRLVVSLLRQGNTDTVRQILPLLRSDPGPILRVVDPQGHELTPVPANTRIERSETVVTPDGSRYLVVSLRRNDDKGTFHAGPPPSPPSLWLPISVAILVSLGFSAWLAWYMVRPVRTMRIALRALAHGNFDTRIGARMGGRRDALADLGRDFDRTAQRLQQQIGAQQRLLHDVSHELRSPLARLEAAIGLIRQNPDNIDSSLPRIERECQRLDTLVGEVLTLSRLESGVQATLQTVDLIELLDMIVEDAGFEAQMLGCTVSFNHCDHYVLNCQAELLHRSFENVIRNALRYTDKGSEVAIVASAEENGLHVSIRDHGPGVPEEALDVIFEPFKRVGTRSGPDGHGLGLAIARRAVASHGGRIWAELAEGGGLRVVIFLPRQSTDGKTIPLDS